MFAYVGCRTTKERNAHGKGLKVYEVAAGRWTQIQLVENLINPSFQCLDETGRFLYTIHGDYSEISSFAVEEGTGKLSYLNTVSTGGKNPVHLSVDKSNRWVFVANLQTGSVAVIPRRADGCLGELKELYLLPGLKADTISHPHQVLQDPSRQYLLVSCQGRKAGYGQVDVFKIDREAGTLERTCIAKSREIAEPRHMTFAGRGDRAYGVNEKDYSVTYYQFEAATGQLKAKQIVPTLPDDYTGDGWASGIAAAKDGRFIYVSNRKHDSVSTFAVEEATGRLQLIDCVKTGGVQPRFITLTPDGRQLVAANELSDTLRIFDLDPASGKMTYSGLQVETENPVCVVFKG